MNSIIELIKNESTIVLGMDSSFSINKDTVISQLFDSLSFITLIERIENKLSIVFSDDDFYEESMITIGDFSDFVISQQKING